MYVLNMVLLLPPAPAARVLDGRALATLSARSAAAFLRIAVAGPPGALMVALRAVLVPVVGLELTGEVGRGADYATERCKSYGLWRLVVYAHSVATQKDANGSTCCAHRDEPLREGRLTIVTDMCVGERLYQNSTEQ
jgi:hypothetical protein